MRHLAQARNPYSRSWLWIPGSRFAAPESRRRIYLPAFHAFAISPISAATGSRIADGVREKRGAGAGWVTPWRSTKIFRAAMCGCFGASAMVRMGAKLRLDRADRDKVAAGAFIDPVEMRAAVEEILLAALDPAPDRGHVEEHR